MQMGCSHAHVCWLKIRRDILAVEVPHEEHGGPAPHQIPQPRVFVPGREVPIASGCKNQ